MSPRLNRLVPLALASALLAACNNTDAPAPATPVTEPAAPAPAAPPPLTDVIEQTPRALVGISYPPQLNAIPGLAAEVRAYSDAVRRDLDQALAGLTADPTAPYELTLAYTVQAQTPALVAVAADGSLYTGGAHSNPLTRRFVWLVAQQRLLRAEDLLADPTGWRTISDYVREQLHTALSARADADELPPAERAQLVKTAGRMIDDGTKPDAASFAAFEPMLDPATDALVGLRFVFPAYQVGPYSDGMRSVDVPIEVLRPLLRPEVATLFTTPVPPPPPPAPPPPPGA